MSKEPQVKSDRRTHTDKVKPSALRSILAGGFAGAVEIGELLTNPPLPRNQAERIQESHILPSVSRPAAVSTAPPLIDTHAVAKTRIQLNRNLPAEKQLGWPKFGRQWYAGCSTLVIGNSLKAGIRNGIYNGIQGNGRLR